MAGEIGVEAVDDEAFWDDRSVVLECLRETPPRIPAWYGYDAVGSELWEELSRLPSYYLTRAEFALLERHAGEIADRLGPRVAELGSGSAKKTRILLSQCLRLRRTTYLPIDVSREMLHSKPPPPCRASWTGWRCTGCGAGTRRGCRTCVRSGPSH